MKIKDLAIGIGPQTAVGFISDLTERQTSKGDPFVTFTLYDKSDSIAVNIWQTKKEEFDRIGVENGSFVTIRGKCSEYNGNKQLTLATISPVDIMLVDESHEEIDIADYIKAAPISAEVMKAYFVEKIDSIKDEELKDFMNAVFNKYGNQLIRTPGAIKVHHEYLNGLGYHTYRMLQAALALSEVYTTSVNKDYLVVGVILHDLGKIKCYSTTNIGSPKDFTLENDLIGHIAAGILMIEEFDLSEDKKQIVRHLILSHHGKIEYGSPVLPMTTEAYILHTVDNLDAKMTIMEDELMKMEEGDVSEQIYFLNRAKILKTTN